ncbi:hypothetical protein [Sporosarcina jiandibaonis]|uniref:hypothetical protein n=1 Tax=Sporosarcina jiandibaonis TaxID=2715535 RepID=UPI001555C8F4|nr:hypothetical protein [Sporosarcina jiandibaonis]
MIRNGEYCIYKNREFEFTSDMEGNLLIVSENPHMIKEGFVDKYRNGVYSKRVKPSELINCYQVTTKGKFKGEIINVSNEDKDKYYVGTSNTKFAQKLGLERTDKYYYEKWVPKNEVEIFEDRKDIKLI